MDSGRIGRLVSIRELMGEHLPDIRPDYRSLYLALHNGAFELMHDLDLALWYAGQPVKRSYCVYGTYSDIGIQSPDVVEFLLDFEDRCTASVHLDFFQSPRRRQIELIGTSGVIIVEFARWEQCKLSVYEPSSRNWTHEELSTDRDDMFRAEDREFWKRWPETNPSLAPLPKDEIAWKSSLTHKRTVRRRCDRCDVAACRGANDPPRGKNHERDEDVRPVRKGCDRHRRSARIGPASGAALAEAGADVAICGRTTDGTPVVRDIEALGRRAFFCKVDLTMSAEIEPFVERSRPPAREDQYPGQQRRHWHAGPVSGDREG